MGEVSVIRSRDTCTTAAREKRARADLEHSDSSDRGILNHNSLKYAILVISKPREDLHDFMKGCRAKERAFAILEGVLYLQTLNTSIKSTTDLKTTLISR